jgi:hypothetical protein
MEAMREETQAEEQQIGRERGQSEARLASLGVLQRPIRELLATLSPPWRWGTRSPCGTPSKSCGKNSSAVC